MNVLSLFDGMSCAQIALNRVGIKYDKYYASEIDKHAIKVTQTKFPDTIHLGSVVDVDVSRLDPINLLFGGSPCQSFSFAGHMKGMSTKCDTEILTLEHYLELKSQGYEFEGQSYLFWEYMRILTDIRKYNPDVKFLLENVMMEEKWERILTKAIGINPIVINSALVSAQNRVRNYWTNFNLITEGLFGEVRSFIPQPKDKGIVLKDILESEVDEKYFLSKEALARIFRKNYPAPQFEPEKTGTLNTGNNSAKLCFDSGTTLVGGTIDRDKFREIGEKSLCLDATYHKGHDNHGARTMIKHTENYFQYDLNGLGNASQDQRAYYPDSKSGSLDTGCASKQKVLVDCVAMRGRYTDEGVEQKIEPNNTEKTNSLTTVQKDNLIRQVRQVNESKESGGKQPYQQNRIYDQEGLFPALTTLERNNVQTEQSIRRLTPTECCRLQTVPDTYFHHNGEPIVSDTQIYRMLGNGWTIDTIAHIMQYLK